MKDKHIIPLFFGLFLLSTSVVIASQRPENIVGVLAVLAAPLFWGYLCYFKHPKNRGAVDEMMMIKMAAAGYAVIVIAIMVEDMLVFFLSEAVFDNKQYEKIQAKLEADPENPDVLRYLSDLKRTPRFYLFLFLMAFVVAAMTEECAKWFAVMCKCLPKGGCDPGDDGLCCQPSNMRKPRTILLYVFAGTMGFSVGDNFGYEFSRSGLAIADLLLLGFIRGWLATPLHLISTCLCACFYIRRNEEEGCFPLCSVFFLVPGILLHGLYDFSSFSLTMVLPGSPLSDYASLIEIGSAFAIMGGGWLVLSNQLDVVLAPGYEKKYCASNKRKGKYDRVAENEDYA